jgi:hypothetical protein
MHLSSRVSNRPMTALLLIICACGGEADPVGLDTAPEPDSGPVTCEPTPVPAFFRPLPPREGTPAVTTGDVPHFQLNPESTPELIDDLMDEILSVGLFEDLDSTLGPGGARAISIREGIEITRPECVVSGREIGHIHLDGSLHAVLPHERIADAEAAGWVEAHPYAGVRPGFEAFVMVFAPRSSDDIAVIFELVLESLNFLTG